MFATNVKCYNCGAFFPVTHFHLDCIRCGGMLDFQYDFRRIKRHINRGLLHEKKMTHWKYAAFYPVKDPAHAISLGEGNTPLIPFTRNENISFKFEGVNPTGSFKDRGSTVEISKAM